MFKCMIVDDEELARNELKFILRKYESIHIEAEASNAIEALKKLEAIPDLDLLFLDIQMPKINGLELAEIINNKENPPKIIFITAYDDYALRAFRVNALDYLLKPIDEEELKITLTQKLKDHLQAKTNYQEKYHRIKDKLETLESEERLNKITVCIDEKMLPIDFSDIIYITVEDKETVLRTKENKYYLSQTLSEIYNRLNVKNFFRCHKSYIINTNYIDTIEPWFNYTLNLKLAHIDEPIPVSRSNVKKFKRMLNIE